VFPVNSPNIEKVEVERESEAMKARLYYLRRRTGKAAMAVQERDRGAEIHAEKVAALAKNAPASKPASAKPAAEAAPAKPAAETPAAKS
jgi:large subunit ribosomal protein L19